MMTVTVYGVHIPVPGWTGDILAEYIRIDDLHKAYREKGLYVERIETPNDDGTYTVRHEWREEK